MAPDKPDFLLVDRAHYYPLSYDREEKPDLAWAIERHYPDPSGQLEHRVRQFIRPRPPRCS